MQKIRVEKTKHLQLNNFFYLAFLIRHCEVASSERFM